MYEGLLGFTTVRRLAVQKGLLPAFTIIRGIGSGARIGSPIGRQYKAGSMGVWAQSHRTLRLVKLLG